MAKRKETLAIENALNEMCREKKIYGCEEITIGFFNNGHGDEIVDFMTMDSKGIIRCYEIKVTLQDLKSNAKKSWYGNYNYLVVSDELSRKIDNWDKYIPKHIGVIVAFKPKLFDAWQLRIIFNPKVQEINKETSTMLKESIVRSMYYKMLKYKDSSDMEKIKIITTQISYWKKEYNELKQDYLEMRRNVKIFERARRKIDGKHNFFEDIVADEMKKAGIEIPQLN